MLIQSNVCLSKMQLGQMADNNLSAWGELETKFFYELTPDKVLDAVEGFGFRCTGRCLTLNSMENRVYEVEIESESKLKTDHFKIIKFYRPGRWTKEQILEEHEFLLDLEEVDIPVVTPMRDSEGSTVCELKDLKIFYSLFPKIGGRNPQELSDDQLPIIGRLLARMHNVGATKKAQHRIALTPDNYGRQSLGFLQKGNFIPENMQNRFSSIVEEICDRADTLFSHVSTQRVHGDCHFGNLLWADTGPFWVDFDDCVTAPPVQDLWLLFPGRDEYSNEQLRKLILAYDEMRSFDWESLNLIESLRSLRMIHFSAWIAKRWEDPAFKRSFVEFGTNKYWIEQLSLLEEQLSLIPG